MSELKFDSITPIEEPVTLGSTRYVLREISGDGKVRYEDARMACYEYQEGKLVKVIGLAGLEPLLVSLCLWDSAGCAVPEAVVRGWPARVQEALYDRARALSRMTEDTAESLRKRILDLQEQLEEVESKEQATKNSPSGSTDG